VFTGIVQAAAPIVAMDHHPGGLRLGIEFPPALLEGLERGASVAVDGVCLSATDMRNGVVYFDAIPGTLALTALGDRRVGGRVNLERSAKQGAEIGGHPMSGHISGMATIIAIETAGSVNFIEFTVPDGVENYIFPRGYLGLNGCSLTVAEVDDMGIFRINLIPETIAVTAFGNYTPGDRLNFEIDAQTRIMVDTLERCFDRFVPSRRWWQ
jgi:riboflavin synthase